MLRRVGAGLTALVEEGGGGGGGCLSLWTWGFVPLCGAVVAAAGATGADVAAAPWARTRRGQLVFAAGVFWPAPPGPGVLGRRERGSPGVCGTRVGVSRIGVSENGAGVTGVWERLVSHSLSPLLGLILGPPCLLTFPGSPASPAPGSSGG